MEILIGLTIAAVILAIGASKLGKVRNSLDETNYLADHELYIPRHMHPSMWNKLSDDDKEYYYEKGSCKRPDY